MFAHLSLRSCLHITGEDAAGFLQGLISNDIRKAGQGALIYAAMLSPQGKFLHDFFITAHEGGFLVDIDGARAADFKKRLMLYRLRSKVEIGALPHQVVAGWGGEPTPPHVLAFSDPRLPLLGWRSYEPSVAPASAHEADYHKHRIGLGVPDGAQDLLAEKSFLLEWGIDQLHGVDYQKGCYVGQEVTARTHYRGQVKKAPHIVTADRSLPAAGAIIYCGEKEAGELRSSSGSQGLALLRLEEVSAAAASGMPLRAGDVVLSTRLPDWFTLADK
ncbi:MAG: folate-binding protein [Alphaproteobacteria bacterium]|nr:folate-binding protein [Alphaproteobacteria bacterium]